MSTPSSNQYFEAIHISSTPPLDPNLFTASELVAGSFDSAAVSTATSKAVSTVNAAAPDSTSISQARSQAVSAASVGSVADSKAVSGSANTSVADSKGQSNSLNISAADSKAVSVASLLPITTAIALSQSTSTADSKAASVATVVAAQNNATMVLVGSPTNDTGAIQTALNTGKNLVFPHNGNYVISSTLYVKTSGQKIYGNGSTITTSSIAGIVFSVGNTGTGAFVKTDGVLIDRFNFVGQSDGSSGSATATGVEILGPPTIPYSEGIGCSHTTISNCYATGFCFGINAIGADDTKIIDFRFGGQKYIAALGAGGYGILLQSCFRTKITRPHGTGVSGDRHAIYVSANPNRTFDNNNVCKGVIIQNPDIDWSGVTPTTGFEAPLEIRSAENFVLSGGVIKGGYGGLDYDAQNGNGKSVIITGVEFRDQISDGISTRSCVSITRAAGSYTTDTVSITNCTFLPAHALMYGLAVSNCNNVVVTGNNGTDASSIAMIGISGNCTNAYFGGNTWRDASQYIYELSGTGNSDITFGPEQGILTGGAVMFHWLTYPTRPIFRYLRTAQVSANSTASPVITSDPYGIIAALTNNANGLNVTFQNNVDTPTNSKILFTGTGSGVCTAFFGSVAGQLVVLGVQDFAGGVLPGASNSYSIMVAVAF